ncbi:MAG TPA: tetratricopeptide repeat protein [Clostridiales bacterium]|nr:tetratricopeptide repeat protein [Clostridiales bacterium]HQP69479.1 tetratricopeptide repeat protein [Clostridiales bacterium]
MQEREAEKNKNKISNPAEFKRLQTFSVVINILSRSDIEGRNKYVYKITVIDNLNQGRFIGYSFEKNKTSIGMYVDYVLSQLKDKNLLSKDFNISSSMGFFDMRDTGYQIEKNLHKKKIPVKYQPLSHKDIIKSIYKELVTGSNEFSISGDLGSGTPILPPVFIDSFIKDIDKIAKFSDFWQNYSYNEHDRKLLIEALNETAEEADNIQNDFDFEKALNLYQKLHLASIEIPGAAGLTIKFILKQAKVYFHLEQYEKSKDLLQSLIKMSEGKKAVSEAGEAYYYLGIISSYSNDNKSAENYFSKSIKLFEKLKIREKHYIYWYSIIRRYISINNLKKALITSNKCLRTAYKNNDTGEMPEIYSLKSEIYIRQEKCSYALENLNLQLDYARQVKDIISEARGITQIFSISAYLSVIPQEKLDEYLARIKKLSIKIKKKSYYYDALIAMGINLKKNKNFNEAEKYFNKAVKVYSDQTTDASSHVVNMIYLAKIKLYSNKYLSAVRVLNKMLKICDSKCIGYYPAYIENCLGRIYYERKLYLKSNIHLRKALKYIKRDKNSDNLLIANTYKFLGYNNLALGYKNTAYDNLNFSIKIYEKLLRKKYDQEIEETTKKIKDILTNRVNS